MKKPCLFFHKWRTLKQSCFKSCMGESYNSTEGTEYVICIKCNLIKRFMWDSQGGAHYYIDDGEEEIISRRIKNKQLFYD